MAKPTHVLVVEDEAALADLLKYNLEKEGYRVSVANDGEEALVVADESAPDLVVLDWMLPKAPGIEVCRRLRARQAPLSDECMRRPSKPWPMITYENRWSVTAARWSPATTR